NPITALAGSRAVPGFCASVSAADGLVQLWDLASLRKTPKMRAQFKNLAGRDVACHPSLPMLAVGTVAGTLCMVPFGASHPTVTHSWPAATASSGALWAVRFVDSGRVLHQSARGVLALRDVETGTVLHSLHMRGSGQDLCRF